MTFGDSRVCPKNSLVDMHVTTSANDIVTFVTFQVKSTENEAIVETRLRPWSVLPLLGQFEHTPQ